MPRPCAITLGKFVLARFRSRRTTRIATDESLSRKKNKNDCNDIIFSQCYLFLASDELNQLLSNLPADKNAWESALTTALALQEIVWENEKSNCIKGEDAIFTSLWRAARFLLQGVYYLQHGLALEQMPDVDVEVDLEMQPQDGSCSAHVTHAAVGLTHTPVPLSVLERLVRDHPEQLLQPGPVHGRLPLHVAAAKDPAAVTAIGNGGGSGGDSSSAVVGDLLELLVEACPLAAARADAQGQYPLHLAYQSGYTLQSGLEALRQAAPYILCQYQYEQAVFEDSNITSTGSIRKNAAAQKELLSLFSSRKMVHDALIQANAGSVIV
jgi:hypothetical protein